MNIAVIDLGSNALRMLLATASGGKFTPIENYREPVRLGHDVFLRGRISGETITRVVKTFAYYADLQRQHHVELSRTIATSATREASNRDVLIERIRRESGIELELITGVEEGRLIHQAIQSRIDMSGMNALITELGGGSMELLLVTNGKLTKVETYKIGAVRLLEILAGEGGDEANFPLLVRDYIGGLRGHLQKATEGFKADHYFATGGNVEKMTALLRPQEMAPENAPSPEVTRDEIRDLVMKLSSMSYHDRMTQLGLDADRADVILPAAIVIYGVMEATGMESLVAPLVGLKEGVAKELADSAYSEPAHANLRDAALFLGRRYQFDESHALRVAHNAQLLFEKLEHIHRLDPEWAPLLDTAAILHDIGFFVNERRHHKHSFYLIMNSNLPGLALHERRIVANVARYHRKATPKPSHGNLRPLDRSDRSAMQKLAAILRVADALDRDHIGVVHPVDVTVNGSTVTIEIKVYGDSTLEKWAMGRKDGLFQEVFGYKVRVEELSDFSRRQ